MILIALDERSSGEDAVLAPWDESRRYNYHVSGDGRSYAWVREHYSDVGFITCYHIVATSMEEELDLLSRLSETISIGESGRPRVISQRDGALADDEVPVPSFIYIGEVDGDPLYYNVACDDIGSGELHSNEYIELSVFNLRDPRGIAENVVAMLDILQDSGQECTLSRQALAVTLGHQFGADGLLPTQQAKTFFLRDIFDVERQRAAQVLDCSSSTVDSHLRAARQKVSEAKELTARLNEIENKIPSPA